MSIILKNIAEQIGISPWIFVIILLWSMVWKLLALWKSARKNSLVWFIVMAITNTLGILPILYIYVFSKMKTKKINLAEKIKKISKRETTKKKVVKTKK